MSTHTAAQRVSVPLAELPTGTVALHRTSWVRVVAISDATHPLADGLVTAQLDVWVEQRKLWRRVTCTFRPRDSFYRVLPLDEVDAQQLFPEVHSV